MKNQFILCFCITFISINCLALVDPTIIWPNTENQWIAPGQTNQIFTVKTNIRRCGGIATLYSYNEFTQVKTFVKSTSYYSQRSYDHTDLFFDIPTCPVSNKYCVGFRNVKGTESSAEIFRFFLTDPAQIGLTTVLPILQLKCNDDLWDPVVPMGGKASITQPIAPTSNYNGLVYHFNWTQNHKTDQPIMTTNNGQGFSPYLFTSLSFPEQQLGGSFKYTIPASPCDDRGTNFNTMTFARFQVNTALQSLESVDGKIIDPDGLFCPNNIRCSLPYITYFPLIGPSDINIGVGISVSDIKYYYLNSSGQRIENARMSSAGASMINGNIVYRKKICFEDLKNSSGVPEVCHYIIKYKLNVITGYNPQVGYSYATCYVEYPTTVTPVTAANQVSAPDKLALLFNTYNNIKNQLLPLPNFTEQMVCDIMFSAVAILSTEIVIEEDWEAYKDDEYQLKNNINRIKNLFVSRSNSVDFYWKNEESQIFLNETEFIKTPGRYKLYCKDSQGMSWSIYNLNIKDKLNNEDIRVSDLMSVEAYKEFSQSLDSSLNYDNFYTAPRTNLNSKDKLNNFDLSFFETDEIIQFNIQKSILYPNPAVDFISIKSNTYSENLITSISLQDQFGRNLINDDFLEYDRDIKIFIGDLSSGTYFIKIMYSDNTVECQKFIKQ